MNRPLRRGARYKDEKWRRRKSILFIRRRIVSLLNRFPLLRTYVLPLVTLVLRYVKRARHGPNVDKRYWVDPKRIEYCSLREFSDFEYKGEIIGGGWDKLERRFEDLDVFCAFKERFIEGKKWEDTLFYRRVLSDIKGGEFLWKCRSKEDFDKRCRNLDALFQNIKNNGYKSERDSITVNVGRKGDLLFNNGAHRLSIVKLLGIQRIPIKIVVRHPLWLKRARFK